MNNKFLIKMAIAFIVIGFGISFVTFALNGFDLQKLDPSYGNWIQREYEFSEGIDKINILEVSNNVYFSKSIDDKIRISCYESDKFKYKTEIKGRNLKIELVNEKKWYENLFHIGYHSYTSRDLIIYLPKTDYEELILNTVSADAKLDGFHFENLELSTTSGYFEVLGDHGKIEIRTISGDVVVKDFKSRELKISSTSGDISIENGDAEGLHVSAVSSKVSAKDFEVGEDMNIQTISGDINLNAVDAKNYDVESVSGDVKAKIKTEKNFDVEGIGKKNYPVKSTAEGEFYVKTISGEVEIEVIK